MRAVGGDGALGRHAGVPDTVGSRHSSEVEAAGDLGWTTDLLVQLDRLATADDSEIRARRCEPGPHPVFIVAGKAEHEVGIADQTLDAAADCRRHPAEISAADRQLPPPDVTRAVDRETGAVGAAIRHHLEHISEQRPELRFE